MRARSRAALVSPLLAVLALTACTGSDPEADEPVDSASEDVAGDEASDAPSEDAAAPDLTPVDLPEGVAATVGEEEITVEELEAQLAPRGVESATDDVALARQVLQQMVQVELVAQAATSDLGVDLEAALDGPAVSARADELIESAGGPEAFEAAAAGQGITAENARVVAEQDAELQLLIEAVEDALAEQLPEDAFDEEAVRAAFEDDPSGYQSSDVAHILLETEQDALDALARLEAGEDFGELAAELSTGPSGPNGGELGVQPRGTYVTEFSEAVYADDTVPGEVVGPVETQFGFHLILVNEIITPSADDVVAEARGEAAAAELQVFATEAFAAREVAVDADFGVWDPVTSSIQAV